MKKIFFVMMIANIGFADEPNYYEPWQTDYYHQFKDIRIQTAAHGLLAPSAHNTQPWKISLSQDNPLAFSLFTDTERLLPETDPFSRQITISQGTFLETAKIAANYLGYNLEYDIFPNGEYGQTNFNSERTELKSTHGRNIYFGFNLNL